MAWATVASQIVFKVAGDTWGGTTSAVNEGDRNSILTILEDMYNLSPTAAALLEAAAAMGPIRFSTSASGNPGFRGSNIDGSFPFIALNLQAIDSLRYFNTQGTFVPEIRGLTIMHEIAHHVHTPPEDDPEYNEVLMNGPAYDFDGPIVTRQNQIANEMGYTSNIQVAYQTGIVPADGRYLSLHLVNYTDGHAVDVVRFGDEALRDPSGVATDDTIDHTLRTAKLRDLLFGFGGDDTLKGGAGNDYLYGGAGADRLWGGEGNDVLVGEDGDDEFWGEAGSDTIWGGAKGSSLGSADGIDKVNYSAVPAGITITFTGDGVLNSLAVVDGEGGLDTLHSIEIIEGSAHADTLNIHALTPAGAAIFSYIDLGGGNDTIDIALLEGSVTVDLRDPQNQTVTFGGAILHLKNAERVTGNDGGDFVYSSQVVPNTIMAGAGNDTIYLAGSGHSIDGGGGYDILNLSTIAAGSRIAMASGSALIRGSGTSAFSDFEEVVGGDGGAIMYGDGRGTRLVGGGGVNYLEGSGTDVLVSGSGDTYFSLASGGTAVSGAGNDYFEMTGSAPVTIKFGVGSGHDMLGSHFEPGGYGIDNDGWIAARQNDMIWLEGLTRDDIELVWNYTEVGGAPPDSGNGAPFDDWYRTGEAAIRIKSTGETLYLGELSYNMSDYLAQYMIYFYSMVSYDYDKMAERAAYNISAGINPDRQWHLYLYENNDVDGQDRSVELAIFSFDGVTKLNIFDLFDLSQIVSQPLPAGTKAAADILGRLDQGGDPGFVAGTPGSDNLSGSGGDDDLLGGDGDDLLDGGAGDDFVRGGAGNDTLVGGAGLDSLHGGPGRDTADYGWTTGGVTVDLAAGTATGTEIDTDRLVSIEDVLGGSGDDLLVGDASPNLLSGGAGDDFLIGGGGDDILVGGGGDDQLEGGAGWDTYIWRPGDGWDVLIDCGEQSSGAENSLIVEGAALSDFLVRRNPTSLDGALTLVSTGETILIPGWFAGTGEGVDEVIFRSDSASPGTRYHISALADLAIDDGQLGVTAGTEGPDHLTGTAADDWLYGLGGDDMLAGKGGNDHLDGGAGADTMVGGAGDDVYIVDDAGDVVTELAGEGIDEVRTGLAAYTLGDHVERLTGTSDAGQTLGGNALDNLIRGGDGANLFLLDQGGDDTALGGGGNDRFYFGGAFTAGDSVDGGAGEDSVLLRGNYDMTFGAGNFVAVERLRLLSFAEESWTYRLTSVDANVAAGKRLRVDGQDLKVGEDLVFNGQAETDGSFLLIGGAGNDILVGGAKNDEILGGAGNDFLYGLQGDDKITGGLGSDRLTGGGGKDIFLYNGAADSTGIGFDTIDRFEPRIDKIDLPGAFAFAGWTGTIGSGALSSASFDADLAAAVNATLQSKSAVLFTPDSGDFAGRTFVVVDYDGDGSYQAGDDYVFEFENPVEPLTNFNFFF